MINSPTWNIFPLLIVTFLFFIVAGNHVKGKEADKYISIETALFESSLKLELRSLGGYRDECIELKVTNLLSDSLFVLIEAGRILESEDVKEQDIVNVNDYERIKMNTGKCSILLAVII